VSFTYLASNYTHADPAVRLERYWAVVKKATELMRAGECVFSPIAHTHEIGLMLGREVDHEFWMRQDKSLLQHASKLKVLTLEGWQQSRGVAEEIEAAKAMGIPVEYVEP
jgi:hypothetical protein